MELLILSMSSDGVIDFRIKKYRYRAFIDTTHYPAIRKWMYRKPGKVINLIKRFGRVEKL